MKSLIIGLVMLSVLMGQTVQTIGGTIKIDVSGNIAVQGTITSTGGLGYHSGMFLNTNANPQTPIAGDHIGLINFSTGPQSGFEFEAGEDGTFTGTADNGDDITITTDGNHTMDVGDWVVIQWTEGGTDITGHYEVQAEEASTFDITFATHTGSSTGSWQSPSQLKLAASGISACNFDIMWNLSVSCAGSPSGDIVDWGIHVNATPYIRTYARKTLSTGSVWLSLSGGGIIPLDTGDVIYLGFESDDTNALTHVFGSLRVLQD